MRSEYPRAVRIIGVPLDLGASRRGVDMGPSAMRAAGLHERLRRIGYEVQDAGNVWSPEPEQDVPIGDETMRYADVILATCKDLADHVEAAVIDGRIPIVLGGDHSIAIGTQAGLARCSRDRGMIWFDAHADLNTPETSPSGNIHGMPLAAALGLGKKLGDFDAPGVKLRAKNTVLVGLRSVDKEEAARLEESGLSYYTMRDIDEYGMKHVVEEAIAIASHGVDDVHLSFDLDAVDPRWAPGTGTTVEGGLTYRESHLAMEMLADAEILTSLEFVEMNPLLDRQNATGKFAVGLIASALGKAIMPQAAARLIATH